MQSCHLCHVLVAIFKILIFWIERNHEEQNESLSIFTLASIWLPVRFSADHQCLIFVRQIHNSSAHWAPGKFQRHGVWSKVFASRVDYHFVDYRFNDGSSNGLEAFLTPSYDLVIAVYNKKEFCTLTVTDTRLQDGLWVISYCYLQNCEFIKSNFPRNLNNLTSVDNIELFG